MIKEGAGTLAKYISRPTVGTDSPSIGTILESMACYSAQTTATTLDTYTDTGEFLLTDTAQAVTAQAGLLELSNGTYHPVLPSLGATGTVTPSMDIPSASEAGKAWQIMNTYWPGTRAVPGADLLGFRLGDYDQHTANDTSWLYKGVCGSAIGDVTIEPHIPIEMAFNFHVGDVSGPNDYTVAAEGFQDSEKFAIVDGPGDFKFSMVTHANPIETWSETEMISAVWKPGIETIAVPGFGSSETLNGSCGYVGKYAGSTLTLRLKVDKQFWTDFEGSNPLKYIALQQQVTDLSNTAWALWMPQCHIVGSPVTNPYEGDFMEVEVTFEPTNAGYGADTTDPALPGAAPWIFAISGEG